MFDEEVISFAHGNGLRAPDSAVVAAGIAALLDHDGFPLQRYNFLERHEPLEESIHTTMLREGFPLEHLDALCIDAGTTKLFTSFLATVTEPGDAVLTAPAFYHGLVGWCRMLKLGLRMVPATAATAYKLSYAGLDAAWCDGERRGAGRPSVVVVFNPTPSGAIYTAEELGEVAEFCDEHDLVAIEDNVFARTRFDPYAPIAHLADDERMRDRVVSVDGCSKADGLANLRVGWAVGPRHLVEPMEQIKVATTVALPYVTLVMADTALRVEWGMRQRDAAVCRGRAAAVTAGIAELNEVLGLPGEAGLRVVHEPRAGHAVMVDAGAVAGGSRHAAAVTPVAPVARAGNSLQLAEDWLDRAAVAVSPLYSCGLDGHELRLNFASVDRAALPDAGQASGGRREHPAALDVRPGLVRALARDDRDTIRDLCRLAEREAGVLPPADPLAGPAVDPVGDPAVSAVDTAPGLIHEGLVERLASALRPHMARGPRTRRVAPAARQVSARQPEPSRLSPAAVG